MALTSGFFNALNHDRLYDASQMSSLFDGIIKDGIFSEVGDKFICRASGDGLVVDVGSGRAWFNHVWVNNDTDYPIELEEAEVVLNRIDAVVIEINSTVEVRDGYIRIVKGTPSSNAQKPEMTHNDELNQYPLCYVSMTAGKQIINDEDIENAVGLDATPFVTGLMQVTSTEELVTQWQDQWNQWISNMEQSGETWTEEQQEAFAAYVRNFEMTMNAFEGSASEAFNNWFQGLQDILDDATAGHLQNEIDALSEREFNHYNSLDTSNISISKSLDGTTTISETTSEAAKTTRISKSSGVTTITEDLVPNEGSFNYTKTTTISTNAVGNKIINTSYIRRGKV